MELELCDDPEIAASSPYAPEEIGVLLLARLDELALSRDQVDGER
jgi:hypothetical protein